ncbi:MAG: ZIP family metal transporter [Candidatus Altiarchaeota archaeon]
MSLLSLVGVISLSLDRGRLNKLLNILIAFASGSMLAAAFFDLIPEASNAIGNRAFTMVLLGIVLFFMVEKFIHWHHCGKEECEVKPVGYLNLLGDGVHNFIDGVVIAAAYLASMKLGLVTTVVIALHEIPQEFGDFAVLLHAGFKVKKALVYNFLSAATAILGGLVGFMFLSEIESMIPLFLGLAAGGFIYISTADLMPELHKENERAKMVEHTAALLAGVLLIYVMLSILPV